MYHISIQRSGRANGVMGATMAGPQGLDEAAWVGINPKAQANT